MRLATLAHAISRTKPTAPNSIQRPARTGPTMRSCTGSSQIPTPLLAAGYSDSSRAAMAYLQLSGEVYAGGPLPAVEREMIAVVVSAINGCRY